jgi:hypothetical protein
MDNLYIQSETYAFEMDMAQIQRAKNALPFIIFLHQRNTTMTRPRHHHHFEIILSLLARPCPNAAATFSYDNLIML